MGNLLFSPSGRINKSDFMKGVGIIAVISALIKVIPMFSVSLGGILSLLSLVLIFPLFCLMIKRSHDGGKSGWMSIVWFILLLILIFIMSSIVPAMFGGDAYAEMKELTEAAVSEGAGLGEIIQISQEFQEGIAKNTALPSAILGFVVTMFWAFLINVFTGKDVEDNQFGPVA